MLAKKPENICRAVIMQQTAEHSYHRLVDGYNSMISAISTAFADSRIRKMSLSHALQLAREEVILIGDITPNEADELAEFIKRDINDAAECMMETSTEFSDWLMLDIDVVERKMVEMFLSVAEQTRTELEQLFGFDPGPGLY